MPSVANPLKRKATTAAVRLRVLNKESGASVPKVPTHDLCVRIVTLAQTLSERVYYPYQVQLAYRVVKSILLRDGKTLTALLSRQSGKSEVLSSLICAILIIIPILAKKYPNDWRFNMTDDGGRYRGFKQGIKIGIYAPKAAQAEIMFGRVKSFLETDTCKKILKELGLEVLVSNGDTVRISNGSRLICQTASINAKIEGETHNFLVLEEAQDIDDKKIKKSLMPMVASTKGSIVMIGTASTKRCSFYETIKKNERLEMQGFERNHFFYPHSICSRYNSLYREFVEEQKATIGESSDEFKLSYDCEWLFERGMFVTHAQLFDPQIAMVNGPWSLIYDQNSARQLPPNYSLVAGIDWGRDHDSTVVTIVAVDWSAPVFSGEGFAGFSSEPSQLYQRHIISWKAWNGDNYEVQFEEIKSYLLSWGRRLVKVVTDSNSPGKPIYDRLVASFSAHPVEIVAFNFSPKVKSDGYRSFYSEICGKRITFPASEPVRKLEVYRKFVNETLDARKSYKNGLMQVAHADMKHCHDDFLDSAMLATYGTLSSGESGEIDVDSDNIFFSR